MTQELWEILIPASEHDEPFSKDYHRIWDAKIRAITGGLTIHTVAKGQWVNKEDGWQLYEEQMIPVRVSCTREQLEEILKITKEHYKQTQIMAVKISSEVIFYE
jgi:hypothetical protein